MIRDEARGDTHELIRVDLPTPGRAREARGPTKRLTLVARSFFRFLCLHSEETHVRPTRDCSSRSLFSVDSRISCPGVGEPGPLCLVFVYMMRI